MSLTKEEFELLYSAYKKRTKINNLKIRKYITNDKINKNGLLELEKYKVKNAIILAAGMSSRFAPLSYEKPKGLAMANGEVLIERLIKQLKEAGVEEIIVVLGHMLDKFVYLKYKFNVKLVINNDYKIKNTHSSIFAARDFLGNSYICCADNYYPQNPFQSHEYRSFTSALYVNGIEKGERGVFVDKDDLIIDTQRPAVNQYIMLGFQYFDNDFCKKFKPLIEDYYHDDYFSSYYWEQLYARHVKQLKLYIKRYEWNDILEFDTIKELEKYDNNYLSYGNYQFIDNICKVLHCKSNEIKNLTPINKGLTNKSFSFEVKGKSYIYRLAGLDAPVKIDRALEKSNQELAKKIGIDDSYIYEDEDYGWKISKYIDVDESFNFNNIEHVKMLCKSMKKLYSTGYCCGKEFNYIIKIKNILERIKEKDYELYNDVSREYNKILMINKLVVNDKWNYQLIHNDIWEDNLLISKKKLYLIDWEYAGDADIGYDISKLCVRSGCSIDNISECLKLYFERIPTDDELLHIIGCVAVSYYYWYVWAVYMKSVGNDYDSWIERYKGIFYEYYNEYRKRRLEVK